MAASTPLLPIGFSKFEVKIRRAAREGRLDKVQALLTNSTLPNSRDPKGMTPLHHAVKRGHLAVIELLLTNGAHLNVADFRGRTPLYLALKSGSDLPLWSLLFGRVPASSSSPSPSKSRERVAEEELAAAFQRGDFEGQIVALVKRALFFLEESDWWRGALTLNSAYVVAQAPLISDRCRATLFNQLEQMESNLFSKEMAPTPSRAPHSYRSQLRAIRREAAHALQSQAPATQILLQLTSSFKELLRQILADSIKAQGEDPPTRFAMVGLGSMSRNEMAPYSDVEFLFLIEEGSDESRAYFRSVAKLMALKIANLGETKFKLVQTQSSEKSLAPKGFSVDIAGLSPLGQEGLYELIGAPEEIAYLQTEAWFSQKEAAFFLVNALTTSCLVAGDASLLHTYQRAVDRILNQEISATPRQRLREVRALKLIRDHLDEFRPQFRRNIEERAFDIKKNLYRLPHSVINALAFFYGCREKGTVAQLEELKKRGFISDSVRGELKQALESILRLRIQAHLFYGEEREILYQPRTIEAEESEKLLLITPEIKDEILHLYQVLIPLRRLALEFIAGNKKSFMSYFFVDLTIGSYDERLRDQDQFQRALASAEEWAAFNLNSSSARGTLGCSQFEMGQLADSLESAQEALDLAIKQHGDQDHPETTQALCNFGNALLAHGRALEAIESYEKSRSMELALSKGSPTLGMAIILASLGNAYSLLEEFDRAIELYHTSLEIEQEIYRNPFSPIFVKTVQNLASIYSKSGRLNEGLKIYEELVSDQRNASDGQAKRELAISIGNLGAIYLESSRPLEAIPHFEESFARLKELYGDQTDHPEISDCLMNLGAVYQDLGDLDRAINYYQLSLSMKKCIYEMAPHPTVAALLVNLGAAYRKKGETRRAIESFKEGLKIRGQPRLTKAQLLNNLGNAHADLEEMDQAIDCFNSSLEIKRGIYQDRPHRDIANSLTNLGRLYCDSNQLPKAFSHLISALSIYRELYHEISHPDAANTLTLLAEVYLKMEAFDWAVHCSSIALSAQRKIHGDQPNEDVINLFLYLGRAHKQLDQFEEAIKNYKIALNKLKNQPSHRSFILENIGDIHRKRGNSSKTIKYYTAALDSCGDEAALKRAGLNYKIGSTLEKAGQLEESMSRYEASLSIYKQVYKSEPRQEIAEILIRISLIYFKKERSDLAISTLREARAIRSHVFGESDPKTKDLEQMVQQAYYLFANSRGSFTPA